MHGADRAVRLGGAAKPCRAWPAFRFRVLPFLPWTILFDDGLGLPITFEADQYLGTEGREDREEAKNWQ
jgi:hypothetical protein